MGKMNLMLETFDDLENKIIVLAGDFNLFLDSILEAEGFSLVLKNLLFQNSLTFGELEIQKKNASHFNRNIAQVFYKED